MTKAEEIAFKYVKGEYIDQQMFSFLDVTLAMKEYAELYATKCLEKAFDSNKKNYSMGSSIFHTSILDIKLPEHD